ncbi:hypothetical protein MMC18_002557, partial [Xylographa bjoerkii]|nr:hypothetical protein [Xylographa bjoerkii]
MSSTAAPAHDEVVEARPLPAHYCAQLPTNSSVENIAVRRSDGTFVTVHNTSELIEISPQPPYPAKVVYHFPANLSGIVEVGDNVFYISTGSFSIYKVALSPSSPLLVSKLVDVAEAVFLNGSAVLDPSRGLFLDTGSLLGALFAIDTKAATASKWLQHGALTKVTNNPYTPGINGITLHSGHLYLSNTDTKTFLRVGVSSEGNPAGEIGGDDGRGIRKYRERCDDTLCYDEWRHIESDPDPLRITITHCAVSSGSKMLRLLATLVILSLTRLSAAQFDVYPTCVQPLLDGIFPVNCLSLSLAAQNTCLCSDASTYANALVKGLYQACGCTDLQTTLQLATAYCAQVGIDVGPAFGVFVQDDTPCSSGTGTGTSAGSGGSTSMAAGSTGTATAVVASTPTSSNPTPVTVFVTSSPAGSSTNAAVGGGTTTVVVAPKNFAAN